jgi:hypothetical protein
MQMQKSRVHQSIISSSSEQVAHKIQDYLGAEPDRNVTAITALSLHFRPRICPYVPHAISFDSLDCRLDWLSVALFKRWVFACTDTSIKQTLFHSS